MTKTVTSARDQQEHHTRKTLGKGKSSIKIGVAKIIEKSKNAKKSVSLKEGKNMPEDLG